MQLNHKTLGMPTSVPPSEEVLALRKLGRPVNERFVEWAISMLMGGQDTPGLRVLAGESSPFNQFEMGALVDRVFAELGLTQPSTINAAAGSLATVRAKQVLAGDVSRQVALKELAELHVELDNLMVLHDFYLLHYALEDLQMDDMQWYWPGADRHNIEDVIDERFRSWLQQPPKDA